MSDVNAAMMVIRKFLTDGSNAPTQTRWNEDCDCVETSTDGGETWTQNDGADPRKNPAYQNPPNTESDPRCAAAGGLVVWTRQIVTAGIDATTITALLNVILSLMLVFLPIALLFALVIVVTEAIFAIGGAALSFTFTEDVYDRLLCIFYCHTSEAGTYNHDDLDGILADVFVEYGSGVVFQILVLMVQLGGVVGFNNAATKYADPLADCSECLCSWCHYFDFTIDEQGWTIYSGVGSYDAGIGFKSHDYGGENAILIQHSMTRTTSIRRIAALYTGTDDNFCGAGYYDGSFHSFGAAQFQEGSLTPRVAVVVPTTTTADVDNIYINEDGLNSSLYTLIGLWVYGDFGPNPFGDDNCPPE